MRILYRILLTIVRVFFGTVYPVRQIGRENIPEGSVVICSNHCGYADPLLILLALDLREMPSFMAKKELLQVPILGPFVKAFKVFGVDRGHADANAMDHAGQVLSSGQKIIIFPQGTRVRPGKYARAKSGAVRLALGAGVPIVPMYIPEKKRLFRKNLVVIGKPYYLQLEKDASSEQIRGASQEILDKIFTLCSESGQKRLSAASPAETEDI